MVAAWVKAALKASKEPKSASIFASSAPVGAPPPFGFMHDQKKVWFHTWAALLNTPALLSSFALRRTSSSRDLPCSEASFSTSPLRFVT